MFLGCVIKGEPLCMPFGAECNVRSMVRVYALGQCLIESPRGKVLINCGDFPGQLQQVF